MSTYATDSSSEMPRWHNPRSRRKSLLSRNGALSCFHHLYGVVATTIGGWIVRCHTIEITCGCTKEKDSVTIIG
jgi:hypothetical protein